MADRAKDELQALSLGNQQRVQLAAALVFGPNLLILDEPFSGLDPVAVDVMSAILREQADAGLPVLFSSHELELVEHLCDRVAIIDRGRIVANGTVGELRTGAPERRWVDVPNAADTIHPSWSVMSSQAGIPRTEPGVPAVSRRGSAALPQTRPR